MAIISLGCMFENGRCPWGFSSFLCVAPRPPNIHHQVTSVSTGPPSTPPKSGPCRIAGLGCLGGSKMPMGVQTNQDDWDECMWYILWDGRYFSYHNVINIMMSKCR